MKILVDNYTKDNFTLEIKCKQLIDKHGFCYGEAKDYCGSTLSIDAEDIRCHHWSGGYSAVNTGVSYVVVCPLCGEWIEIPSEKIPKRIRDNAREISRRDYYENLHSTNTTLP